MNTTKREKNLKELVLGKCWKYIHANFDNFNQANKIKISLALLQKSMPQEITGMSQQIIISATIQKEVSGEPENTTNNRIAEYFSGPPYSPTPA